MRLSDPKLYSHRTTLPPKNLQKVKSSYKMYPKPIKIRTRTKQKHEQIKTKTKILDPYRKNYQQKISNL